MINFKIWIMNYNKSFCYPMSRPIMIFSPTSKIFIYIIFLP